MINWATDLSGRSLAFGVTPFWLQGNALVVKKHSFRPSETATLGKTRSTTRGDAENSPKRNTLGPRPNMVVVAFLFSDTPENLMSPKWTILDLPFDDFRFC